MQFYEVGGCVRDDILGIPTKDIDFAVDMTDGFTRNARIEDLFDVMRAALKVQGFEEFVVTPEFFTVRSKVPDGHILRDRTRVADFVMCRSEGPYSDGRHPDFVEIGNINDDLARRDFTMNAIARTTDGELIDPHGGVEDIKNRVIRFVGDPKQRILEDGVRILRALRFNITKGFDFTRETWEVINSDFGAECLSNTRGKDERCFDELEKMFRFDTQATLDLLYDVPAILPVIFDGRLRLAPTLKG